MVMCHLGFGFLKKTIEVARVVSRKQFPNFRKLNLLRCTSRVKYGLAPYGSKRTELLG